MQISSMYTRSGQTRTFSRSTASTGGSPRAWPLVVLDRLRGAQPGEEPQQEDHADDRHVVGLGDDGGEVGVGQRQPEQQQRQVQPAPGHRRAGRRTAGRQTAPPTGRSVPSRNQVGFSTRSRQSCGAPGARSEPHPAPAGRRSRRRRPAAANPPATSQPQPAPSVTRQPAPQTGTVRSTGTSRRSAHSGSGAADPRTTGSARPRPGSSRPAPRTRSCQELERCQCGRAWIVVPAPLSPGGPAATAVR